MVSNPSWQSTLANESVEDSTETYINICKKFPNQWEKDCIASTVDNLMNFEQLNIDKAASLCSSIQTSMQKTCWEHVYYGITSQTNDKNVKQQLCLKFDQDYQNICTI